MRAGQWLATAAVVAVVGAGAALSVPDRATAAGGTGASSSAGGQVAAAAPRARAAGGTTITFDDIARGVPVTDQYARRGIVFAGAAGAAAPFVTGDASNPTSPVLSGSPLFQGAIAGTFVFPLTGRPTQVDRFSLDVGYIDTPGSVAVTVYDPAGRRLGALTANGIGIVRLTSTFRGASRFVVAAATDEPAGFGIDNVSFTIPVRVAALGDSYSSGEGAGAYERSSGGCHRTARAWPRLLADPDRDVTVVAHLACSGARTAALNSPFKNEPAQLTQLAGVRPAPNVVTLTMGGNDIGFADVLADCVAHDCVADGRLDRAGRELTQAMPAVLRGAYTRVQRAAPDAAVVVVGYPRLFPPAEGFTLSCHLLDANERARLNQLAGTLDQVTAAAAAAAGATFVSVLASLRGHELCGGDPWIYPIDILGGQERAHPTARGQQAIAAAVRTAVTGG
jgi:lysophospholipase L1-like esterase